MIEWDFFPESNSPQWPTPLRIDSEESFNPKEDEMIENTQIGLVAGVPLPSLTIHAMLLFVESYYRVRFFLWLWWRSGEGKKSTRCIDFHSVEKFAAL